MSFLLQKKSKFFLNLLISSILFGFSLTVMAPLAYAGVSSPYLKPQQTQATSQKTVQNPPAQTYQTNQSQSSVLGTTLPDQKTVPVPGGNSETGRVLACVPFTDICTPSFSDILGNLKDLVVGAIKEVILFIFKAILNALGFAFDQFQASCNAIFDQLGDLSDNSPGNTELVKKINLFTLLDSGYGATYNSFPKNATVTNLASVFQENVLGIKVVSAANGTELLGGDVKHFWEKFEQIAIVFMVIALIVIGFMVMLRRRLDPRTVVTATNSLPRFAIALVLIIFSFAISGFFIDLINITVELVRNVFAGSLSAVSDKFGGELFWFPVWTAFSGATIIHWQNFICSPFAAPLLAAGGPVGLFGVLLVILIVETFFRLTLFILAFYLFWLLLKNYAFMILYTIFSPLFFLVGAIPGFENVTGNWFKRMAVNALLFPAILLFIYMGVGFIVSTSLVNQIFTNGEPSAPVPLQTSVVEIPYLIGLGILFFATKLPKFLEKMFKMDDFDIKGGMGPGLMLAPVTAPMAAARGLGSLGKTMGGIGQLANNAGRFGGVASRAAFRAGYQPGTAVHTPGAPGTPGTTTISNVPKTGFGARTAQILHGMIPNALKAPDVRNAGGTTTIEDPIRNSMIKHETEQAEKEFRLPNYTKLNIGEVTPEHVDRAMKRGDYKPTQKVEVDTSKGPVRTTREAPPTRDADEPEPI